MQPITLPEMGILSRIRSLGLRSDLGLIDGEIVDRGEYLVVRSPEEPTYYFGNLLVFQEAPEDGDLEKWEAHFSREFEAEPMVRHRTFTWDLGDGMSPGVQAFVDKGYHHEETVVLTATEIRPPRHKNHDLVVRALSSERDWQDALACQIASRDPEHSEESYREYARGRMRAYRDRIAAGQGEWYGAFLSGRQVGNLGVFKAGGSARYQVVTTLPEERRKGVCGTLVYETALQTLADPQVQSLVMLADEHYHAARIYESLGFQPTEKIEALCLWPQP